MRTTDDGYVGRAAKLLDLYQRRARPSLVEAESFWYSTRPPTEQAARVVNLARGKGASVAVSADLAPDLLVPWRHPTLAIVYASAALTMSDAGFVQAEGRADASIILRWTADRTLLTPSRPWPPMVNGIPITDPVQQWWDLMELGGEDRRQAADRLRQAIIAKNIPGAA
ncbi:MAG: hypothetical protein ABIQ39_08450 [Ilumatobacteraceae bacterium]